jgi:hypothetical protein
MQPTWVIVGIAICLIGTAGCARTEHTDLAGKWTFKMDPDFRGNPASVDCSVRQQRADIVVRCGSGAEMKGQAQGATVTFQTSPGANGPLVTFTAAMDDPGRSLRGTWQVSGSTVRTSGRFEARKKDDRPTE